jgi:hypothetical protein
VADVIAVKLNSGAPLTANNCLIDLNGDGAINVADVTTAKLNSGHVLLSGGMAAPSIEVAQVDPQPLALTTDVTTSESQSAEPSFGPAASRSGSPFVVATASVGSADTEPKSGIARPNSQRVDRLNVALLRARENAIHDLIFAYEGFGSAASQGAGAHKRRMPWPT